MSYKSLSDVYSERCFGYTLPALPRQQLASNALLLEGGAGEHMDHIFDLPQVRTGKDLINVTNKAIQSIAKNPPTLKVDGINAAIKVVKNQDGSMEFGLDRGSKNIPLDIKGATIAELPQRFTKAEAAPGQIADATTTLSIFNKALPVIKDDLEKLKLLDGTRLINMEFIKGQTNVIGYDGNFLVIHGIKEIIQQTTPATGKVTRGFREVSYNEAAMNDLIQKVDRIAQTYGFKVLGKVFVKPKNNINIQSALNTELSVKYDPEHVVTKTLKAWLDEVKNPRGKKVTLADGTKKDALSKFIYGEVLKGTPLNTLIKDNNKEMVQDAIAGAVFYHAARIIGESIKTQLTSEMGDIANHEGIVIRDNTISAKPFKFTGEFIVRGATESKFAKKPSAEEAETGILTSHYLNNKNYVTRPPQSLGNSGPGESTF